MLSTEGYEVEDTSIVDAISNPHQLEDPPPIGLIFIPLLSDKPDVCKHCPLLAPLRPLLSTKNEFVWSPDLQEAFEEASQALTQAPVLSYFDSQKPTRLCTDTSWLGLRFVLQQRAGDSWTLVQAGSHFLSDVESRYAIIDLEMLAVT